jgi:hypothetical protein
MSTTNGVLDHHLDGFTTQDLDVVRDEYDEDSVVITNVDTFRGLDETEGEGLFANSLDEFFRAGSAVALEMEVIEDGTAALGWYGETADNDYTFCADTVRIEDGAVTTQPVAGQLEPK